ncbi:MAG: cytochrome P450 [Pseudomonadales bacterium]
MTTQTVQDQPPYDYLAAFDAASHRDQYPLVQQWMKHEPLPFFKQLREQRPILVTSECTLVTRFDDVRDLLQMPSIFTVDLYKSKMGVTDKDVGYLMAHDDDALHYREKSLMQGMLNRDDIPRVRALIKNSAKSILDNSSDAIEIVNQYCRTVPAILVQEYFGLDGIEKERLIEWSYWNQYDAFHNQPFDLNSKEKFNYIVAQHNKVSEELVAYIAKLIGRKLVMVKAEQTKNRLLIGWYLLKNMFCKIFGIKQETPKDDIVYRMLRSSFAEQVDFSLVRIGVNAGGLLIGAIETTSQAVSQSIEFFLNRPELLKHAQQAAHENDSTHFDNMIWESLRFVPISPYLFRQTSQRYTLAKNTDRETTIPAKTNVLAITQSAMFDDYAYDNPEQFIAERNAYHHFNFGFASHDCLGKYIGMVMIPEMVKQVLIRKDVRSSEKIDYKDGPFPESYALQWN